MMEWKGSSWVTFWLAVTAVGVLWIGGMMCKVLVDIGAVIKAFSGS